jgi:para-nitrobenzyl esterase
VSAVKNQHRANAAATGAPAGEGNGMKRQLARSIACIGTVAGMLLATVAAAQPVVQTQNGPITGIEAEGMREFLGIRYAAPPVGELRWQPPQPVPAALATQSATEFGPYCPQTATPYGVASTSEDCLTLNVFTPDRGDLDGLPVMVWIHGGALVVGGSAGYDPAPLVTQGKVIVVTINYRLGYLGFLAEPGLDAEDHPVANYGLMDQQFALNWVARNIKAFGGNPRRVTIFGESAGGLSVFSHLASPASHRLFQHAIVESGAYALNLPTLAQAEAQGTALATSLGCTGDVPTCLRQASVEQILSQPLAGVTTIVDGTILPLSLGTAFATGQFNRVPVINGTNRDEGRLFVTAQAGLTADQYPAAVTASYGAALTPELLQRYPAANYDQPVLALAAIGTDRTFACPAHLATDYLSKYVPVYQYEFADEDAPQVFLPPLGFPYGAAHASELQYLFNLRNVAYPATLSAQQLQLSYFMVGAWTNFAHSGRPGIPVALAGGAAPPIPVWPSVRSGNIEILVPPEPHQGSITQFITEHQCDFWDPIITAPAQD